MKKEMISALPIMLVVLIGITAISVIDGAIQPAYPVKSAVKVVLFGLVPALYARYADQNLQLKKLFQLRGGKKGLVEALLWGVGIFALILSAYALLGRFFDFSQITGNLETAMGIDKGNFVFVALYISFCNSLLEEFFFRGFACLSLQRYVSRRKARLFSAISFALYHVAMMWVAFEWPLIVISIVGLVVGGCIFNFFNEKYGNLYISWLIHMGANFAINGIAMSLFGIL